MPEVTQPWPAGQSVPTAHSGEMSGAHGIAGNNVVVVVGMQAHASPSVTQPWPTGQSVPAAHTGGASVSHGTAGSSVVVVVDPAVRHDVPSGKSYGMLGSDLQRMSLMDSSSKVPGPGKPPVESTAMLVVGGMQNAVARTGLIGSAAPCTTIGSGK